MGDETVRSRFRKVMAGQMPADRLPRLEWAGWWDKTILRWQEEGLPKDLQLYDIKRYFGLDVNYQLWFSQFSEMPPKCDDEGGLIRTEEDYERLLPLMYPDPVPFDRDLWRQYAEEQQRDEVICWISLSGFFWWPRVLLGIKPHLLAFYDQPELMHRINRDQVCYMRRCISAFCEICVPDFMTFGEDMSYNHGPMISKQAFDEFMAPYYREIIPLLKEYDITCLIDSDGQIEPLIPWFAEVGLEGILPLERMAGVDVQRVRSEHPDWRMVGAFDKTVMHRGEEAVRREFERLLPVMRSGYFVPSVDHQTPPEVSLEDYRLYVQLLAEYTRRACE